MATDVTTLLKLRVPFIVRIGKRKFPLDDILSLGPGAILELEKSADDPLNLLINNKDVGAGVAVKVGENFGVRIKELATAEERVEALAGE
ncbi:FliM/FliN family flagellar motor switch protein [Mucisphaera calidilacus]|uniref:Flagellar motor switch protein FliN n=1 Tax=Mucisphaera calidilacus TaxID=2527982 RepID=A0A518BXP6_9BACT|nr:FliM/FliN family flagellar motor switch protein [Mucisphaera calidilacus]QDU71728.1 Flagellar motor switch protein FliN [Mucisphaera calidilacus]